MNWQQAQQRNHQDGQEAAAQAWEGRLGEPGLLQPEEEQYLIQPCKGAIRNMGARLFTAVGR